MKISTKNIQALADITATMRTCQSIALLDAILEREWHLRYFSFNSKWSEGKMMASMRDGSGDAYFLLFQEQGAILLAQTPHSPVGRKVTRTGHPLPGTFDNVPEVLRDALDEPAFSPQETTFCLWRLATDIVWSVGGETGAEQNGSANILFALDGRPETYKEWADEYYEVDLPLEVLRQIYEHAPITPEIVRALNPGVTRAELAEDLEEISYPL